MDLDFKSKLQKMGMVFAWVACVFIAKTSVIVHAACTSESGAETGGLTTTETTITSPNYPSNYDNNIEQTWTLTVPDNAVVVIRIDDFYLESGFAHSYGSMYPPECPYDFIRLTESCNGNSVILWEGCNIQTFTSNFEAPCNEASLRFRTDGSVTFRGFSITYWGAIIIPNVIDIESAWFRDIDSTNAIDFNATNDPASQCDQVRVRGLMDCAHFAAKRYYAHSFNYDVTEKICYLYSSTGGRFDMDDELRVMVI